MPDQPDTDGNSTASGGAAGTGMPGTAADPGSAAQAEAGRATGGGDAASGSGGAADAAGDVPGEASGKASGQGSGGDLAETIIRAARRGPAPVHLWNPPYCGEMDLVIRADGTWIHDGSPIGRPAMVRLFASVLKREGDRFYLVTPVEKLGIRVEDAPFVAVDAEIGADSVIFVTNLGDRVTAGPDHAIRVAVDGDGAPRPYVHIRNGLDALIDRKTFYRLVEAAEPGTDGALRIASAGVAFRLGAVEDDGSAGALSNDGSPAGEGGAGDGAAGGGDTPTGDTPAGPTGGASDGAAGG